MSGQDFTYTDYTYGYRITLPIPTAITHPKIRAAAEDLIAKDALRREANERVALAEAAYKAATEPGAAAARGRMAGDAPTDLDAIVEEAARAKTAEADAKAAVVAARETVKTVDQIAAMSAATLCGTIEANRDEWREQLVAGASAARDKLANGLRAVENSQAALNDTLGLVVMLDMKRESGEDYSKLSRTARPHSGAIKLSIAIQQLRDSFGRICGELDGE
ncbi:hypothetical protein BFL35_07765 [Clavibacter michiganensis]|nr:hypothetical protein BFL35_07765 [Clavibacter michiganensis]